MVKTKKKMQIDATSNIGSVWFPPVLFARIPVERTWWRLFLFFYVFLRCPFAEGSHPRLTDTKKRCLSAFIPATNHKSARTWDDLGVHPSKIVSDFHIYMEYPQLYVYIIYILVVSEPPFGWVALFEAARDRKSLAGSTWQLHRLLAGAVLDPNWNLLSTDESLSLLGGQCHLYQFMICIYSHIHIIIIC